MFDGWGYVHLFRNTGTDLEPVDDYAIDEALDPRFAQGYGDLSVHEWATDPDVNLGYVAYYAGGMRVFRFGDAGLEETGKFIDEAGQQLLGRRGLHDTPGRAPVRGLGPRLRAVPVPVHRPGGGPAAGGLPAARRAAAWPAALKETGCENQIRRHRGA